MKELVTPPYFLLAMLWWGFGSNTLRTSAKIMEEGHLYGIHSQILVIAVGIIGVITFVISVAAAVMSVVVSLKE